MIDFEWDPDKAAATSGGTVFRLRAKVVYERDGRRTQAGIQRNRNTAKPEYSETDLKGAVRGKYAKRFAAGTNLVRIDADLIAEFADEQAMNDALRWVLTLPGAVERLTKRTG